MIIQMKLLSDAVFGNGESIPGGEDTSTKHDQEGFPFYSGNTLRGILREEMLNYLIWTSQEGKQTIEELFGKWDMLYSGEAKKIKVTDFIIPYKVKEIMKRETDSKRDILNSFTYLRRFTEINEQGTAKKGSLRSVRCLIQGISFYGEIDWPADKDIRLLTETLHCIKWIGSMRNRGFGKVVLSEYKGGERNDDIFKI